MSLDPDILETYANDREQFLASLTPRQRSTLERMEAIDAVAARANLLRASWAALAGGFVLGICATAFATFAL